MIKINLLPSNLYEAQRKVWAMVLCFVVLIGVLAGSFMYVKKINAEKDSWSQQAVAAEQLKAEAERIAGEASKIRAAAKDITDKVAFFKAVGTFNNQYPYLYEELAKFTYRKIVYVSIKPDGQAGQRPNSLEIEALAPSLSDCGRYLLNMYRASHIFSGVKINEVPGFEYGTSQSDSGQLNVDTNSARSLLSGVVTGQFSAGDFMGGGGGYSSGMSAVESALDRNVDKKPKGFGFKVTCTLSDDMLDRLTLPVIGGAAPAAGAPGLPGAAPTAAPAPAGNPAVNAYSPAPKTQ